MKKLISILTTLALCVSLASCAGGGTTENTSAMSDTKNSDVTTSNTEATTTEPIPQIQFGENEVVTLKVGEYVNLVYNPAYCQITTNVEQSVGNREKVALTIVMRDGFTFNGWSQDKAISNGGSVASKETTYNISASEEIKVWANYSANIIYDPNGGTVKSGGETYKQEYSVVWFRCPNTLPEKNYFVREGYTLVEYNTKADGTGTAVGLGSRTTIPAEGNLTLYCIWEKQNEASDFTVKTDGTGVAIKKYSGTATNVVIPETINGKNVVKIASGAFKNSSVERVVLNSNIVTVENGAFENCKKLETLVMFDSLASISGKSFTGTTIKNLRVNAVLDLYKEWTVSMSNVKFDSFLYGVANNDKVFAIYGGSGAYYGFDCAAIDEALNGEYFVVNLGINANLSAAIIFEYMSNFLGENDTVLWAPEAGSWMFGDTSFSNRTWGFLASYYDVFRYVDISNYSRVFDYYSSYASDHAGKQQSYEVFSDGCNHYGDAANERAHSDRANDGYSNFYNSQIKSITNGAYSYIDSIFEKISANGVKLYYTYPAMDETATALDPTVFENLTKLIENTFGFVVISDYTDSLVSHECMYDSEWHLTAQGAKIRTEKLIEKILAQIAKEGT